MKAFLPLAFSALLAMPALAGDTRRDIKPLIDCYERNSFKHGEYHDVDVATACTGVRNDSDAKAVTSCFQSLGKRFNYGVASNLCSGVRNDADIAAVTACYDGHRKLYAFNDNGGSRFDNAGNDRLSLLCSGVNNASDADAVLACYEQLKNKFGIDHGVKLCAHTEGKGSISEALSGCKQQLEDARNRDPSASDATVRSQYQSVLDVIGTLEKKAPAAVNAD